MGSARENSPATVAGRPVTTAAQLDAFYEEEATSAVVDYVQQDSGRLSLTVRACVVPAAAPMLEEDFYEDDSEVEPEASSSVAYSDDADEEGFL